MQQQNLKITNFLLKAASCNSAIYSNITNKCDTRVDKPDKH